ncbi:MAG: molybdopterin-dependent oxidoreductase, partial [Thermoplasmata archaeon]|nr:molybdopterin-dependent oxidoreductase [Thermoplasmata archaeon]
MASAPPPDYRLIGTRIPYVEGPLKVTGRAEYTDDIQRPGQLFGRLLRSPWPHARLRSIDVTEARATPGVFAVLTGEKYPVAFGVLPITHDETAIAVDKARYIGDIVAAVAATDERTAEIAVGKIKVDYEVLPEYSDPRDGTGPVKEQIHARGLMGSNVQKEVVQHFGDVDAAFAQAAHRARVRGTFAGVTHAFTEPMATIAEATPDGRLTVWSATQVPHYLHRSLS